MRKGVTLLELLIVLLIIGILAGVTLSAIDRVRERGFFDETMAEMKSLVKAITGDPDLISDGKRIDFGYVGDMGKLPDSLGSLLRPEGPLWKGPYYKLPFTEDMEGYKKDAWGRYYQYLPEDLTIRSFGNGRFTLTLRIADSLKDLFGNTIYGSITDRENTPPGDLATRLLLKVTYPRNGEMMEDSTHPNPDGFYQFTNIPIGRHRIYLFTPYETLTKYVAVTPKSRVLVDFRVPKLFRGNLIYLSSDTAASSDTILFWVHNWTKETIPVFYLNLLDANVPDTVVCYNRISARDSVCYAGGKIKEGEVAQFSGGDIDTLFVFPEERLKFKIGSFTDTLTPPNQKNMYGRKVKIRFSEGSLIEFKVGD
jgi:prepilin-type N-terminal cleavage/methylation domain-containing protein|uniref:Prepilin-type N-terminal cleavage/methylation domain-containing protein n=1 Tax=candidate division WOR-3 bacterium TaxID=2052148 RepID=A0A7C3UQF0_UNCW3